MPKPPHVRGPGCYQAGPSFAFSAKGGYPKYFPLRLGAPCLAAFARHGNSEWGPRSPAALDLAVDLALQFMPAHTAGILRPAPFAGRTACPEPAEGIYAFHPQPPGQSVRNHRSGEHFERRHRLPDQAITVVDIDLKRRGLKPRLHIQRTAKQIAPSTIPAMVDELLL
jgi:hypothetical protein